MSLMSDVHRTKLETIIEELDKGTISLNDWEQNFCGDVLRKGYKLSDKQEECLEKIWIKHIEKGDPSTVGQFDPDFGNGIVLEKTTSGYFVYIDGVSIGNTLAKSEGKVVCKWLSNARTEIEQVILGNAENPLNETGGQKTVDDIINETAIDVESTFVDEEPEFEDTRNEDEFEEDPF